MKNVGLSMIGGGFMGKLHTLAIQSYPVYYYPPAVNVFKECVVDVNPAVAEMSKIRYGFERSTTDYHDLFEDDKTTAVVVATPNFLHKPIVLDAIKAGKNVFCEKPLAKRLHRRYTITHRCPQGSIPGLVLVSTGVSQLVKLSAGDASNRKIKNKR